MGTVLDTVTYTYGDSNWGDLLTGYDGKTITYDTIGNPLSDGTWTYTWEHGRELASMSNGSTTWSYEYNADGLRTKRTNGSTTYSYIYNGSSLSRMTVGSNTLYFAYDATGTPMSVTYNDTVYYYVTNIQGDITAILNTSGTAVVQYTYDAWGNILTTTGSMASTLGETNPLRYRGYVYDRETRLYYLQSRYYDPNIGRFINADTLVSTGQGLLGNDMFAYCRNNPVSRKDVSGTDDIEVVDLDGNPTIDEDDIVGGGCDAQPVTGMCSGGVWSTFVTTMKNATKGLMMAMGEKEGTQEHHFFSNKNTVYTPRYEEIVVDKYGLDLNGKWNVRVLDNHRGRHTNKYHEFMECMLYEIDNIACGDLDEFLFGVGLLEDYIEGNAWIPYAR